MNTLIFINELFAAFAVIFGLGSRNFSTSVVTGLFIGLIHAGIVALHGAQTATTPISDLPYVKDVLDAAMSTGYLTFDNARYAVYLAGAAIVLMAVTMVCYFVRWIACRIVCSLMPKQDTATQG
jgi:hypothetical protein